ncbi:hypothetical protein [Streptococcus pluranimalium]|uniref:hypothetical protein n=1 Tax=Streptococcus pluranimalium TaxID=82348 RepID=UPI003F692B96
MNDKILSNYELLCAELENIISTLEIAISDIDQDKSTALVAVATNGLKHLVSEHTGLSDKFFKEYGNEFKRHDTTRI